MQTLVLRWTLWGSILAYTALGLVGLSQFLTPPFESVPLASITRSPPVTEYRRAHRPFINAEYLPLDREAQAVVYREKPWIGRRGWFVAEAGNVDEFPTPSVTYLSQINVYLVRTQAGFTALWGRESGWERRIKWVATPGFFMDTLQSHIYTLTGRCLTGPCFDDIGQYAVKIDGNEVTIDVHTRRVQARR